MEAGAEEASGADGSAGPETGTGASLGNVCRLCCAERAPLMANMHELEHVAPALRLLTRLHIDPDDGLPDLICYRCLHDLERYSKFRLQCIQSDEKLRSLTGIYGNDVENSNSSDVSNYDYAGLPDEHKPVYNSFPGLHHEENKHKTNDYVVEDRVVMVVDPSLDYDSSDQSENEDTVEKDTNEVENAIDDDDISHAAESFFKNVFMCQYCDRAFIAYQDCKQHELDYHDPNMPYGCDECSLVFQDRTLYIQHAKTVHCNDKPYSCTECDKGFGRRSDLRKHSIVHTGIRPYQCQYCHKSFSRNTNLSKHLRIHSGQKPHVCPHCPRSFTGKVDLDRHVLVHQGFKPFTCNKCPLTFSRKDKLIKHELKHAAGTLGKDEADSDTEETAQDDNNMVISLDPYSNLMTSPNQNNSDGLDLPSVPDHITGESTFANQMPHNMGNYNNQGTQNIPSGYGNQGSHNMQSSYINQMSQNAANYNQNNTAYGNQSGHVNDGFAGKKLLGVNVSPKPTPRPIPIKTMKPKNIKCHQCPKKFATLDTYKSHVSMHMGLRNFECKVCLKRFGQKYELDRHSVTHTGFKPFACDQCDKTFTRKDKLRRHERTQHETMISSMPCIECGATFEKKVDLVAHIKSHFSDTFEEKQPTEIKEEHDSSELNVEDNYYDMEA